VRVIARRGRCPDIFIVAKNGPNLTETGPSVPRLNATDYVKRINQDSSAPKWTTSHGQLANYLANGLKTPVEDQTGLKGHYDVVIQARPDEMNDELGLPGLYRRILSEYGLRFEGGKVDAPFLVIDAFQNPRRTDAPKERGRFLPEQLRFGFRARFGCGWHRRPGRQRMDSRSRSIAKAVSYAPSVGDDGHDRLRVRRQEDSSFAGVGTVDALLKVGLYFLHERIWIASLADSCP